jgi:demethylmenaquinone methyltransferase/2-methoxy-6-polyprenyl-1,4-benzoquinol methylase
MLPGIREITGVEVRLRQVIARQIVVGETAVKLQRFGNSVIFHCHPERPSTFVRFFASPRMTAFDTMRKRMRNAHSKFYSSDSQRAEKVHALFATIARRYDLLNDLMSAGMHRRWKRRLIKMAGQPRGVLDLCCGTGDIARMFDSKCVVGVDFTEEMLRIARRRRPSTFWVRADVLRLPFADNSFDVVTVGYGLRNLADLERGLVEVLRVLRPGGKLLSLDFGKPVSRTLRSLYFGYLRTVLPVLGRIFCGDRDTHGYILASLENYPAQRGLKPLMESCGFRECGFDEFIGGTMAINFGVKPNT